MARLAALLPRSLLSRVMLLYVAALVLLIALGFGAFLAYAVRSTLDDADVGSQAISALLAPAVSEAAVIGDYDTIKRTLDRAIAHPLFQRAAFIDLKGARIEVARQDRPSPTPPDWLVRRVAAELDAVSAPIVVGGRDYGITRLHIWSERIAADIWQVLRLGLLVAVVGLLAGAAMVWWPLRSWLGHLARIQLLGAQLQQGEARLPSVSTAEAPLEFQRTFEVLNEVAASLQAERAQAAVTLASIGEGVAAVNLAGEVVLANPVLGQLLGQPSQALLGRPVASLLPELGDGLQAAGEGWQGRRFERGEQMLEAGLTPVRADAGDPAGSVLVLRDVTAQQLLEDQLRAELDARAHAMQTMSELLGSAGAPADARQVDAVDTLSRQVGDLVVRLRNQADQLHAIFNLSPDGFISFDAERRVQYVSPACAFLIALPDRLLLGQDEAGLEALLQDRMERAENQRALRLHELVEQPRTVQMARPMPRILCFALHDGGGAQISQMLHIRDVSQQFELDRLKSEFLATAAHELRTPMTSIYGFSELLLHRQMKPEVQADLLQRIHRQSRAMVDILNELLDLARIEARRALDFEFAPVALQELLRQTVGDFGAPEGRQPAALDLGTAPHWVQVDASKLGQALRNLLSNAYKYSPGGGGVTVRVLSPVEGRVDVEVRDEGIGMTPEELDRVTERFYRADKSGAIPGTGLGMAIVKEIVELMGGSLQLASEPQRGTCVTVRLPTIAAPADPA
ncbi:MAG: PAS domain-containing protein [Rubrivivax sp.]|nr:MAG: PAS domain-containing protein [Rubrivivax sp.]